MVTFIGNHSILYNPLTYNFSFILFRWCVTAYVFFCFIWKNTYLDPNSFGISPAPCSDVDGVLLLRDADVALVIVAVGGISVPIASNSVHFVHRTNFAWSPIRILRNKMCTKKSKLIIEPYKCDLKIMFINNINFRSGLFIARNALNII